MDISSGLSIRVQAETFSRHKVISSTLSNISTSSIILASKSSFRFGNRSIWWIHNGTLIIFLGWEFVLFVIYGLTKFPDLRWYIRLSLLVLFNNWWYHFSVNVRVLLVKTGLQSWPWVSYLTHTNIIIWLLDSTDFTLWSLTLT